MRTRILPLALLFACAGPAGDAPGGSAVLPGAFHYLARGKSGAPLLEGEIDIRVADDSTVGGSWNIRWAPGADTTALVGPQVGSGVLRGSFTDSTLVLQLNPNMADNNVSLLAARGPKGYTGRWQWSTIAGPTAGGAFEAIWSDSLPTPRPVD
ncbi:MAG TPA: hypothetical protein VLD58_09955 [Gemmatimonadales bacterium]|nr:hypothetical protein [Gemmatimonadales bacterium]